MAYGDLKVRNLIWNTGSGDNTVVLSTLLTGSSPNWTGTATGVNLTLSGDLQVNGTTTTINTTTLQVEDKNIEIGKVSSPSDTTADGGGWSLLGATTKTFNWVNATDAWTSSEHIHLGDSKILKLGTDTDAQLTHTGSFGSFNVGTGYLVNDIAGDWYVRNSSGSENRIIAKNNGAVELYHDNSKHFYTRADGAECTRTGADAIMTVRGKEGYSGILKLASDDGDDAADYVQFKQEPSTESLRIQPYSPANNAYEDAIVVKHDGAVELYYDNSKKFETNSGGVKWYGNAESAGHVWFTDDKKAQFGASNDLEIYHASGGISYIAHNHSGGEPLHITSNGDVKLKVANTEDGIIAKSNGAVELYYDGSNVALTDAAGLKVGRTNGTNSYITMRTSAGDAGFLYADSNTDIYLMDREGHSLFRGTKDGQVRLFYDHVEKISTTSAGVTISGTVSDSKGDLRKIIFKQESSAYTLVAADAGKAIEIQGNITVPNNVFAGGDAVTLINDSGSGLTISKGSGFNWMFNTATGDNANRTLAGRGMATLYFVNGSTCYISGAGLS